MKLSNLIDNPVRRKGTDERIGRCVDVIVDMKAGRVAYVLVGDHRNAAVIEHVALEIADSGLVADISQDRFEQLRENAADAAATGPLDLAALPPVIIGPFGFTLAPVMMGAVLNSEMSREELRMRPDIDQKHAYWHWFSRLLDLPVFDIGSELGTVEDIRIDPVTLEFTTLDVAALSGAKRQIPFKAVGHVTRDANSIILR